MQRRGEVYVIVCCQLCWPLRRTATAADLHTTGKEVRCAALKAGFSVVVEPVEWRLMDIRHATLVKHIQELDSLWAYVQADTTLVQAFLLHTCCISRAKMKSG